MTRSKLYSLLALALALALVLTPEAEAQRKRGKKKEIAELVGTVVDKDDQALAGIRVTVTSEMDPELRLEATSDAKGVFTVQVSKPEGSYHFHLEGSGYAPFEGTVTLQQGERAEIGFQLLDEATDRRQQAAKAFNAGVEKFNAKDFAAARAEFLKASELAPSMAEPYLGLAEIYYREENLEEAAQAVERYLADKPDDVSALTLAYTIHRGLGNEERTGELTDKLAKTDKAPALATQVYNEGVRAVQEGDNERAIEKFERAAGLDPSLAPAYSSLATIYYNEERYGEADATLEKLFALDPKNVQGRRVRYLIFDALNDQTKAAEALDAYVEADPTAAADLMYQRADLDFRDGNTEKAITILLRVLELDPELARAHYTLGLCYASSDAKKARFHFEKFLELAPDDPETTSAREMLSYL